MKTSRAPRSIVRLAPPLAWLVVCALATPHASAAGCAHPSLETGPARASASLRVLEIANEGGASWTLPGAPCDGPRCRSKAPTGGIPGALVAVPNHHDAAAFAAILPPPPSSLAVAPDEPPLRPILAASALERPPRAG